MRRRLLLFLLPSILFGSEVLAYYNPGCGCCNSYFSKLEKDGIRVKGVKRSGRGDYEDKYFIVKEVKQ